MIITRFRGEMLFSQKMRATRLNGSIHGEPAAHLHTKHFGASCRLPPPRYSALELNQQMLHATFVDATAWPILCLVAGYHLEDIFELPTRNRGMPPPFGWNTNEEEHLRFCAACALEQRQQYGVSWWMRDANLPIVAVCPFHEVPLHFHTTNGVLKSQLMPHELLEHSHPIPGRVTVKAKSIARKMIELCNQSAQIDTDAVRERIELNKHVVRPISADALRSQLGVVAEILHPVFFGKVLPKHDGLTSRGSHDRYLLTLALGKEKISDMLYHPKRLTAEDPLLSSREIDETIGELLAFATFHKVRPTPQALAAFCKRELSRRNQLSCRSEVCIEFLLLHWLEPRWIQANVAVTDRENGYRHLSDDQVLAGLYLLKKSLRQAVRHLSQATRDPEIRQLMKQDRYIPEWGGTYLSACASHASAFLKKLKRSHIAEAHAASA